MNLEKGLSNLSRNRKNISYHLFCYASPLHAVKIDSDKSPDNCPTYPTSTIRFSEYSGIIFNKLVTSGVGLYPTSGTTYKDPNINNSKADSKMHIVNTASSQPPCPQPPYFVGNLKNNNLNIPVMFSSNYGRRDK